MIEWVYLTSILPKLEYDSETGKIKPSKNVEDTYEYTLNVFGTLGFELVNVDDF